MRREINGIPYNIKNTMRSRRVLIAIDNGGQVTVSKSPRISIASVQQMLVEKFLWIQGKLREQALKPKKILAQYSIKDFKENKEKARALVHARLKHFNIFYSCDIGRISIRNQKSRWGSCSSTGNLNFNYKIVFLPIELVDYIIVHELCHLKEMNHGKRFWALVSQTIPDYKERQNRIRLF
jgi:predicted metal-dependent hydrolase